MKKKKNKITRLTASQISRLLMWGEKGLNQRAIAKKLGCARSTVSYHLNN